MSKKKKQDKGCSRIYEVNQPQNIEGLQENAPPPKTALDFAFERKVPSVFDLETRIIKLEEQLSSGWLTNEECLKIIKEQTKHCVFYPEENNETKTT